MLAIDIAARLFFRPVFLVQELSIFSIVAVVYLGMSLCEEKQDHINTTALIERFSANVQKKIHFIIYLITFLGSLLLVYASGLYFLRTLKNKEAISGSKISLVIWPITLINFIGLVFYSIQIMINAINRFKGISSKVDISNI